MVARYSKQTEDSVKYCTIRSAVKSNTYCLQLAKSNNKKHETTSVRLHATQNISYKTFPETKSYSYTRRLLMSVLSGNRASGPVSTSPFSFLLSICSNVPLLFKRFVGVPSYSLPLYPLRNQSASPSLSAALSERVSSKASRFRFCAVLGVSINRRSLLSCSLLFTSAVTSMCSTT